VLGRPENSRLGGKTGFEKKANCFRSKETKFLGTLIDLLDKARGQPDADDRVPAISFAGPLNGRS